MNKKLYIRKFKNIKKRGYLHKSTLGNQSVIKLSTLSTINTQYHLYFRKKKIDNILDIDKKIILAIFAKQYSLKSLIN